MIGKKPSCLSDGRHWHLPQNMHPETVFTKTSKGALEAAGRSRLLNREQARVLALVDGRSTVAEIREKLGRWARGRLEQVLDALQAQGFVRIARAGDSATVADELGFSSTIIVAEANTQAFLEAQAELERQARRESRQAAEERERERTALLEELRRDGVSAPPAPPAKAESPGGGTPPAEEDLQGPEGVLRAADAKDRPPGKLRRLPRQLEEARLAAELEARARRRLEARAREEAERRAREEAEARRRAEEEARAQAEAERRAREEAERRAREEAEARRRAEEEARAQAEAERRAREEAERRAREEAEARRRAEEEARALAEAERRAREEAERRAREEAEARRRAEEEARALAEAERRAREEAERRTRELAERRAREEAAARARAEEVAAAKAAAERAAREAAEEARRFAEEQARRLLEEEERERQEAEARAEEMARLRGEQEAIERLLGRKRRRLRLDLGRWLRRGSAAMVVGLVVGLALAHLVPFDFYAPRLEERLGRSLGEPVRIGGLRFSVFPTPRWKLDGVSIGTLQDIHIERAELEPELTGWGREGPDRMRVRLAGVQLEADALPRLAVWRERQGSAPVRVRAVSLARVRLAVPGLDLPAFGGQLEWSDDGNLREAVLVTADQRATVRIQPLATGYRLNLSAVRWVPPVGAPLELERLEAEAMAQATRIEITRLAAEVQGGSVEGTGRIGWGEGWKAAIDLRIRGVGLAGAMPAFTGAMQAEGRLDAKARILLAGNSVGSLTRAPEVRATFLAREGLVGNVDLVRAMDAAARSVVSGGATRFEELSGYLELDRGRYHYRQLRLKMGLLTASGSVTIGPDHELAGTILAELRSSTATVRVPLVVAGTLAAPTLRGRAAVPGGPAAPQAGAEPRGTRP